MKNKTKRKNNIFESVKYKWKTPTKWTLFGLVMGIVIATVGSVAALNGWFGAPLEI